MKAFLSFSAKLPNKTEQIATVKAYCVLLGACFDVDIVRGNVQQQMKQAPI